MNERFYLHAADDLKRLKECRDLFFLSTVVIRRGAGWRGVSGIISGCVSGESEWPV